MTWIQVQNYIDQIPWAVPMERIRYYLRDIKHWLYGAFNKDYHPQPELDENETIENHRERELAEIQRQAILSGIKPPIK